MNIILPIQFVLRTSRIHSPHPPPPLPPCYISSPFAPALLDLVGGGGLLWCIQKHPSAASSSSSSSEAVAIRAAAAAAAAAAEPAADTVDRSSTVIVLPSTHKTMRGRPDPILSLQSVHEATFKYAAKLEKLPLVSGKRRYLLKTGPQLKAAGLSFKGNVLLPEQLDELHQYLSRSHSEVCARLVLWAFGEAILGWKDQCPSPKQDHQGCD